MTKPTKKKEAHWSGSQMICPWFSREETFAISCRGQTTGIRLRMTFDQASGKKAWACRVCETYDYWKCPMCEMIDTWEGIVEEE